MPRRRRCTGPGAQLDLARPEVDKQPVHLVQHFAGTGVGRSILLITTIGARPRSSAFMSTKRVCRQGPSQASTKHHAIDQRQRALDLPTKIRMPRSIDNVDLDTAAGHRGVWP